MQAIELSDTPFYPDQIHKLSRTRILMGVHGAGLGNMIWMEPEQGGVVEIMHGGSGGLNSHYSQMADMLGLKFVGVNSGGGAVNVEGAVRGLNKMMDTVA